MCSNVFHSHFLRGRGKYKLLGTNTSLLVTRSSNKKLLVTKGVATRSKDATRGSWPYYLLLVNKKLLAGNLRFV